MCLLAQDTKRPAKERVAGGGGGGRGVGGGGFRVVSSGSYTRSCMYISHDIIESCTIWSVCLPACVRACLAAAFSLYLPARLRLLPRASQPSYLSLILVCLKRREASRQ